MEEFKKIIELAAKNPNDMTLGFKVRKLINEYNSKKDLTDEQLIKQKIDRLIELSISSRVYGLNLVLHHEKCEIVSELVNKGILKFDNEYLNSKFFFASDELREFFNTSVQEGIKAYEEIKNFLEKE